MAVSLSAQEVLFYNYSRNVAIHSKSALKADAVVAVAPVQELPFYEDFSSSSPFPDPKKWIGDGIYVNDCFAVNQPSIGVATFDALDASGMLYENASSSVFGADTLTSAPIALGGIHAIADTVRFSFYYQIGGLDYQDNWPGEKDSLLLEFYAPSENKGFFINEIGAKGIELYNGTKDTISLSGFTFRVWNDSTDLEYVIQPFAELLLHPFNHLLIDQTVLALPENEEAFSYVSGDSIVCHSPNLAYADTIQYINMSSYGTYGRAVDGSNTFMQFTAPSYGTNNGAWKEVWAVGGFADPTGYTGDFSYVTLSFDKFAEYLVDGFRFRFVNLATLSNSPTHARNADYFNIDQIYIDVDRADKMDYPDVAFSKPLVSFLKDYYSVPFSHFESRQSIYNESVYFFRCHNFDRQTRKVKYAMAVDRLFEPFTSEEIGLYETDLPGRTIVDDTLNLSRFLNPIDVYLEDAGTRTEAEYLVKMYFEDDVADSHRPYRFNDTLNFVQSFGNYYAYDDGTSEAGYGVRGERSMAVAQKFTIYERDTLRAVSFFFNQTLDDPNLIAKRFKLAVWKDNGKGQPGDLLYESPSTEWVDTDVSERNQFQTIFLEPDGNLIVEGTIHIGWTQTTDFLLNVGVDLNRKVANKVNYRFGETWTSAYVKNPLMIHAHVGSKFELSTSAKNEHDLAENIAIYPTFANNELLYVAGARSAEIHIYSLLGALVFLADADGGVIDISVVPSGMYIVYIVEQGKVLATEKIIVEH